MLRLGLALEEVQWTVATRGWTGGPDNWEIGTSWLAVVAGYNGLEQALKLLYAVETDTSPKEAGKRFNHDLLEVWKGLTEASRNNSRGLVESVALTSPLRATRNGDGVARSAERGRG